MPPFVALLPDALEFVELVLDQAIKRGGPGVSGPVDSLELSMSTIRQVAG